ncbi:Uncharacterised protein [Mobiluncus mulieris]|nr:Uncharacterised protein [Mobiluncus mulieris]
MQCYLGVEMLEEIRKTGVVYAKQQMIEICGLDN